jgi:hypothetical protein
MKSLFKPILFKPIKSLFTPIKKLLIIRTLDNNSHR